MTWIAVIVLAALALIVAVLALRLPRKGWTLFAAVLLFGLAGYALQGSPDLASSPRQGATAEAAQSGEALVAARRALFDDGQPPPGFLTISDGFARRGRYEEAAQLLRNGLAENPDFGEGWLALANALVEHTGGRMTPAARYAYDRAEDSLPGHPGPGYFLGIAFLRSGQPGEARDAWAKLLANTPEDAPWRDDLSARVEGLGRMLEQSGTRPPR